MLVLIYFDMEIELGSLCMDLSCTLSSRIQRKLNATETLIVLIGRMPKAI